MSVLHPVVELLLARMKSHPEEFTDGYLCSELEPVDHYGNGRWEGVLRAVCKNGNEAELEAVNDALRSIRLGQAHEWMMDELFNGEERRRKAREEQAYERNLSAALRSGTAQPGALIPITNPYANVAQLGHPGQFITDYDYATQTMRIKDTHTGAVTAVSHDQLEDKGFVATIKKALGI